LKRLLWKNARTFSLALAREQQAVGFLLKAIKKRAVEIL
jgi:hypothetical protein